MIPLCTFEELKNNALVQALGLPENAIFMSDGCELDYSDILEENQIVTIAQKASQKA